MKKILTMILCCTLIFSISACSSDNSDNTETSVPSTTIVDSTTNTDATMSPEEIKVHMDNVITENKFEGIVYLTQNGSVVYQSASGKDEMGNDLTVGSSMYIGSVSKQFCSTAIMMLKEQGKLSVDDTLDKYFPEYEIGKDIAIKNLLTMRSGIINTLDVESLIIDEIDEMNIDNFKEWIFKQPLKFEPDSKFDYSNTNYFLLSCIVEQVSGNNYNNYIRENIFEPLKMSNTGFVSEVADNPNWNNGHNPEIIKSDIAYLSLILKGAGDISSNSYDMDKWKTGLVSGKIISRESYEEMIVDYSPDYSKHYGYGLMGMFNGGIGHTGSVFVYTTLDYTNEKYGYNLFISNNVNYQNIDNLPSLLLKDLLS